MGWCDRTKSRAGQGFKDSNTLGLRVIEKPNQPSCPAPQHRSGSRTSFPRARGAGLGLRRCEGRRLRGQLPLQPASTLANLSKDVPQGSQHEKRPETVSQLYFEPLNFQYFTAMCTSAEEHICSLLGLTPKVHQIGFHDKLIQ